MHYCYSSEPASYYMNVMEYDIVYGWGVELLEPRNPPIVHVP